MASFPSSSHDSLLSFCLSSLTVERASLASFSSLKASCKFSLSAKVILLATKLGLDKGAKVACSLIGGLAYCVIHNICKSCRDGESIENHLYGDGIMENIVLKLHLAVKSSVVVEAGRDSELTDLLTTWTYMAFLVVHKKLYGVHKL